MIPFIVVSSSFEVANEFAAWLDAALSRRLPPDVRAFSFNLYEGVAATWDLELTGVETYDPANPDWACDPIFYAPELLFLPKAVIGEQWEQALAVAIGCIADHLRAGKRRAILRDALAVGVGFVDGDLTILWPEHPA